MVARIVLQAAAGLHAVHQAGVVHCDVKPANLFLRGNGSVTVGDFGIAIPSVAARGAAYAGSPFFAAPEQWRDAPLDRRCDIYALGATTHFLVRKEPPFSEEGIDALKDAHLNRPYTPPPTSDSREAFLILMIETMMQKNPEARPATAAIVARNLEEQLQRDLVYEKEAEHSYRVGGLQVTLHMGDLAQTQAAVIVNAANQSLTMKEGVASALRKAGGASIEKEAMKHAPVMLGDVVWTKPGRLRAKAVAHAVSAVKGAACIQRSVLRALFGAERRHHRTVSFPVLGTGVAEIPAERAAHLMLEAFRTFAEFEPIWTTRVKVVFHTLDIYRSWLDIVESI